MNNHFRFATALRYRCDRGRHRCLCCYRYLICTADSRRRIRGPAQRSVDELVWREESRSLRVDLGNAATPAVVSQLNRRGLSATLRDH